MAKNKTKNALAGTINTVSGGSKAADAVAKAKNSLANAAKNAKEAYQEAQGKAASNQARLADEREQQRQQEERERQMQEFLNSYAPSVDFMGVYNDYANRMGNILQQQKDALNQQTTSKARSAYVANEQGKNEIPRLLSNAGVTGGIAEKVRTNQNTSYQQNLANILSDTATQGAELERNNANLISEAYKEAMGNQQAVDNERALAAQQYANQLALQQQQQEYEAEERKQQNLMNELQNAASSYKNILNNKNKMVSSVSNQLSGLKKDLAARGADEATLKAADAYILAATEERYYQKLAEGKMKMSKKDYMQKYGYDRIK